MAAPAREDIISLLNTVNNVEKRLERDVKEVCDLLQSIMKLRREEGVDPSLGENGELESQLQSSFLSIYMCLKLHLAFHLGEYSALNHKELRTFAREILKLPDGPEMNSLPDERHAVDPGSKVLEIVSMQQVLNNNIGWMELNVPLIISR